MQELVGADRTVQNIWSAFETRFNIERTPGQDLLNDLSTGLEIRESDPKAFWKFVDNCRLALDATKSSENFRSSLASSHTQELIAKRLGNTGFKEWNWHRQGLLMQQQSIGPNV